MKLGINSGLMFFSAFVSLLEPWGRARDAFGELERVPRAPQRKMQARGIHGPHNFVWGLNSWQCVDCGRTTDQPWKCRRGPCTPLPRSLAAVLRPPVPVVPAHDLWAGRICVTGAAVVFCNRCGSYTTGRTAHLIAPCTTLKVAQLRMLRNGVLPYPKGCRFSKPWRVVEQSPRELLYGPNAPGNILVI